MFGFLCPKGGEREVITEANCHKAVSPATATSVGLCVQYCEDAEGGAAGGDTARCLSRTLVSTASIVVRQAMSEQLKNKEKVTYIISLKSKKTHPKFILYGDLMDESPRRLLCVTAVNSMSC